MKGFVVRKDEDSTEDINNNVDWWKRKLTKKDILKAKEDASNRFRNIVNNSKRHK